MEMSTLWSLVTFAVFLCNIFGICHTAVYTDTWAVQIEGGEEIAQQVAEENDFNYLGKIIDDHYHFHHRRISKRSVYPSHEHHQTLLKHPKVKWAEQQVVKRRVKRDYNMFNDPKWPRMWYLWRPDGYDMNVKSAWKKGYTGKGVVVSILDDGIEKDHPDLKRNYDAQASFDVNGHDPDPQPRYDFTNENRHGTRCAGEVAAEENNGICSVGVAYNARIGGVRMLDGDVTDAVEAQSLGLNPQHIDIYSASWGPDDDGRTVDGPASMARRAFENGIRRGRRGKGSIYIWASGNGGRDGDSCNCDGYTNSIYTLSISSTTENGNIPWYSEACSSTLTSTYSSGSGGERQIVTTDLRKGCTETHTGTSASAPLAAGICALALQANPRLTWRDLQHIVVLTSRPANLKAPDWVTNGVGRRVSHSFGFGLMDASAMVDRARNWTNVPEQHRCEVDSNTPSRVIRQHEKIQVSLMSRGCQSSLRNQVIFVEHVQAIVTISSSRRGELQVFLTSPSGTKSTLLQRRTRDTSTEGFNEWAFMTTHNWGESSIGRWTLEVHNGDSAFGPARLRDWRLVMYGTDRHPYTPTTTSTTTTTTTTKPTTTHSHKNHRHHKHHSRDSHTSAAPNLDKAVKVPPCTRPQTTTWFSPFIPITSPTTDPPTTTIAPTTTTGKALVTLQNPSCLSTSSVTRRSMSVTLLHRFNPYCALFWRFTYSGLPQKGQNTQEIVLNYENV